MTRTGWMVVIIIVLLVIGGFFFWSQNAAAPAVQEGASSDVSGGDSLDLSADGGGDAMDGRNFEAETGVSVQVGTAPMTAAVTYNGSVYSPASVTIARGGTVTFTDSAGATMWVASDEHPTHTSFDGTSRSEHCVAGYSGAKPFDQCGKGASYSFTFDKAGTYQYHDHANASAVGTVIVQ